MVHKALLLLVQNQGVVPPVYSSHCHVPQTINDGNSHHTEKCLLLCPHVLVISSLTASLINEFNFSFMDGESAAHSS